MSRPTGLAVIVAAGLFAGGLAPLVGQAAAVDCPSFTDAPTDSSLLEFGLPNTADPALDIVETTVKTVAGGDIATVVKTGAMSATPNKLGDQYAVQLEIDGQNVMFYADRDPVGVTAGVINPSTNAKGTATAVYDPTAKTVTITAKQAEVDKAAGKPTKDMTAKVLNSTSANQAQGRPVPSYDTSPAPAGLTYVVGAPCGGDIPTPPLPTGYPRVGCDTFTDTTNDGTPDAPVSNGGRPVAEGQNDADLDIVGLAVGTTDDHVVAALRLQDLKTAPSMGNGHEFEVSFTHNTRIITMFAQQGDQVVEAKRSVASASGGNVKMDPPSGGRLGGTYNAALAVTATFDPTHNLVFFKLTRASLETVAAAPAPDGTTVTAVSGTSRWINPHGAPTADTVQHADQNERTFTFGDSPCFQPPAAKLVNTGGTTVQFTDTATFAAKLTDEGGTALAGRTVTFRLGTLTRTATTAADGVASVSVNPGVPKGAYSLVTSFAGDDVASKTSIATPFAVAEEKTKITLTVVRSGTKRTVTAKLLDDDNKAVARQAVALYVNGKKVATRTTSTTGVVTLPAVAGQTVQATFTTVTGRYLGSTARMKV